MNLIDTLKQDLLKARKAGDTAQADALRFIVGEAERYAKGSVRDRKLAGQPLSDTETVRLLQGAVVNLDASVEQAGKLGRDTTEARAQRDLFSRYLPALLSRDELQAAIQQILREPAGRGEGHPGLGDIMRELGLRYPRQYDGALARTVAQELLRPAAGAADLNTKSV